MYTEYLLKSACKKYPVGQMMRMSRRKKLRSSTQIFEIIFDSHWRW